MARSLARASYLVPNTRESMKPICWPPNSHRNVEKKKSRNLPASQTPCGNWISTRSDGSADFCFTLLTLFALWMDAGTVRYTMHTQRLISATWLGFLKLLVCLDWAIDLIPQHVQPWDKKAKPFSSHRYPSSQLSGWVFAKWKTGGRISLIPVPDAAFTKAPLTLIPCLTLWLALRGRSLCQKRVSSFGRAH